MIASIAQAQSLQGVYRLEGGREMAAEFHFTPDGHFEFGYGYGAVDRGAEGTYTIDKGHVLLHSTKTPGKDFTVKHREHRGEGFTVHITDQNSYLTRHVVCFFRKGDEVDQQNSDENGIVHSKWASCDSIYVLHTLFPDVMTLIKDAGDKTNNYFELGLNPSLAELSFKDIHPLLAQDSIVVEMPWLFEKEKAVFVKSSEE